MSEFNDYLFDYFSHKEELDMSDSTREMLEDCFYRKQKEIKKLKTQLKEASELIDLVECRCDLGGKVDFGICDKCHYKTKYKDKNE